MSGRANILLVGGFGDGRVVGTTYHVRRKLKKWSIQQKGMKMKIKALYFGGSSICGQSLRRMASSMRKQLSCSIEKPYRGIVYGYSMGSLLVKIGVVEGWIDPSAVCFCCGAHRGMYAQKGVLFEKIYCPSDAIRSFFGLQKGAVRSIRDDTFTKNLDDAFRRWLNYHPMIKVLFVGHMGDRLIPIESSVPETYRDHPQAEHLICPKNKRNWLIHIQFPSSKKCLNAITTFIETNLEVSTTFVDKNKQEQ